MNVHLLKVKWKEGELQQNTYVVEQKDGCILIDAGVPLEEIRKITDKPISAVMLTHAHFDHIEYIEEYDRLNIPIYASIYAERSMLDPSLNVSNMIRPKVYHVSRIYELKDNETITIGDMTIKCLYTPGHSRDSVCYLIGDKLFSGDTLFSVAIGRTDFPDSNEKDMIDSLSRLDKLEYSELYPGHGRVSNKEEQNQNIKQWLNILKQF